MKMKRKREGEGMRGRSGEREKGRGGRLVVLGVVAFGVVEILNGRTKSFALRIINLYSALPNTSVAQVLGKQILRSGTSVGAHYREAHRARSTAEFVSKINGGLQELEETGYWLELIGESGTLTVNRLTPLAQETQELIAIFVTLIKNAKNK